MYSLGMGDKKIYGIFSACQFTSAQVCSAMHRELLVHLNIGSQRLVSEIRQKIKICTYRYKLTYTHYIHALPCLSIHHSIVISVLCLYSFGGFCTLINNNNNNNNNNFFAIVCSYLY